MLFVARIFTREMMLFWNVLLLKLVLYVVGRSLDFGCFVESFVFCGCLKTAYL